MLKYRTAETIKSSSYAKERCRDGRIDSNFARGGFKRKGRAASAVHDINEMNKYIYHHTLGPI